MSGDRDTAPHASICAERPFNFERFGPGVRSIVDGVPTSRESASQWTSLWCETACSSVAPQRVDSRSNQTVECRIDCPHQLDGSVRCCTCRRGGTPWCWEPREVERLLSQFFDRSIWPTKEPITAVEHCSSHSTSASSLIYGVSRGFRHPWMFGTTITVLVGTCRREGTT